MVKEIKIKSVSAFDMAKYQGLIGIVLGGLMGILYAGLLILMAIIMNSAERSMNANVNALGAGFLFGIAIFALIFFPILYGVSGFILGYIFTGVGNRIFRYIGGVRVTIMEGDQSI